MAMMLLSGMSLPEHGPMPEARPGPQREQQEMRSGDAVVPPKEPVDEPQPPVIRETPQRLGACLAELAELGAVYLKTPAIEGDIGCGIDQPLEVTSIVAGIALEPAGTMRCETALQLARWTKDQIVPILELARPGEELSGITHASGYACRKRNGDAAGKISEHARGNAIDIAALRFRSGTVLEFTPRAQDPTLDGAAQRAIAASACLYFTTVLAPGSDAAHQDHLHLDIIDRRAGYRHCR